MLILIVMWELIDFIKCQITIIINWLPIYKILLFTYLALPALFLTYYQNKSYQTQKIKLAIALLLIWIIQMVLWNKGYSIYYEV